MTPIAKLLKQGPGLCRSALAQTHDVNEAYLLVHNVMAGALRRVCGPESDLAAALAAALEVRSRRLAGVQAAL